MNATQQLVNDALASIAGTVSMKDGIAVARKRKAEFKDILEMYLTGVAMVPAARQYLDDRLEAHWQSSKTNRNYKKLPESGYDEVVIGGGPHAASYCAARVAMGHDRPLVIEHHRIGGSFAVSRAPSFAINSRNRPGPAGLPSSGQGLNVIPGAPIQMSALSTDEFQTNADVAFVVRQTIAQNADVLIGKVTEVNDSPTARRYVVALENGRYVTCDRVIDARGLGEPVQVDGTITAMDFLASMDEDFPLRNLGRVAIVGDGDSAKCAAEALLGIAPTRHMSLPQLDWVSQVDWYSPSLPTDCSLWRRNQRGRYQALGSFLQLQDNGSQRLKVIQERGVVTPGFQMSYVNGRPYDTVINATGWKQEEIAGSVFDDVRTPANGTAMPLAIKYGAQEAYAVGPAASLEFTSDEFSTRTTAIEQNKVALFRLTGWTAALAAKLPYPTETAETETIPSVPLGKEVGFDRYGETIRVGDRVSFDDNSGEDVTGRVVESSPYDSYKYCVVRDDGERGGGPNDSWLINSDVEETVVKL